MAENKGVTDLFKFLVVRNRPTGRTTSHIVETGTATGQRSSLRVQFEESTRTEEMAKAEGEGQSVHTIANEFLQENRSLYEALRPHLAKAYESLWQAQEAPDSREKDSREKDSREKDSCAELMSKFPSDVMNRLRTEKNDKDKKPYPDKTDQDETTQAKTKVGQLLEDMVMAWSLMPPDPPSQLDEAIRLLRFWYVCTDEKGKTLLPAGLESALNRVVIVLPNILRDALKKGPDPAADKGMAGDKEEDDRTGKAGTPMAGSDDKENLAAKDAKPQAAEPKRDVEPTAEVLRLKQEVKALNKALDQVDQAIRSGTAMETIHVRKEEPPGEPPSRQGGAFRIFGKAQPQRAIKTIHETIEQKFTASKLPEETLTILERVIAPKQLNEISEWNLRNLVGAAIQVRESQIADLQKQDHQWLLVGNLLVKKLNKPPVVCKDISSSALLSSAKVVVGGRGGPSPLQYYAGVADLKIVKEKLMAYELTDIAHTENVLAGEEKERRHRRLETTETEEVVLTESEEETERDTQSTTKNELATESSTVAKETVKVEGSLTVSGKYGPTVEFSAAASAGYTGETTSSEKRAAAFAQEVVQKTVEKVRERVMQQRRVKTVNEIEETNVHGLKNAYPGAKHVRGLYRWLNKISEARVYNYGARHMFSFVVPEPASFYLWSLGNDSAAVVQEPVPPDFSAFDITPNNYESLAAAYGASGVKAAPEPTKTVSAVFKPDAAVSASEFDRQTEAPKYAPATCVTKSVGDKITIPVGYDAIGAHVHLSYATFWNFNASVFIGDRSPIMEGSYSFNRRFKGELACGGSFYDVISYFLSFDVQCAMYNDSALARQWKLDTFDAIMEGYKSQLSRYEEKLATATIQQGIAVPGRNPLENEWIIKNELKRACLSLYLGIDLDTINAFRSTDSSSPDYWKINHAVAPTLGLQIAFLERAFEWEHMTYLFHPYFYGRVGEWSRRVIELGLPDPNMSAFLRAGAARVLVPARPEFAEALLRFAQVGNLPPGNESLLVAEDAIEAMIEEVRARGTDSIPNAEPEGDPWEVKLPTSLVLLQDPQDITFRDVLYGDAHDETQVSFDHQQRPQETSGGG